MLASTLVLGMSLTACGGGGDGGGDSDNTPANPDVPTTSETTQPDPVDIPATPDPIPDESPDPVPEPVINPEPKPDPFPLSSADKTIALQINNKLSLKRSECGFGGVDYNEDLTSIAERHTQYLKVINTNVESPLYNPHIQATLIGAENFTGKSNPYFFGRTALDRILTTSYGAGRFGVFENIATRQQTSNNPLEVDLEETSSLMLTSLLAAPYHAKALLDRRMVESGAGFAAYTPYGKDSVRSQGHILVMNGGTDGELGNNPKLREGVLTYPCDNQEGLAQALYNESPNPFGNTRDLAANPIGQPVYVIDNNAKDIKVTNVKFTDVDRNIDVPVKVLDAANDPHADTNSAMQPNEAFIMPLTDNFNTCRGFRVGNCGLYEFTNHSVSFDLITDGKLERRTVKFKTGKFSG